MNKLLACMMVLILAVPIAHGFDKITGVKQTERDEFVTTANLSIDKTAVYTLLLDLPEEKRLVSIRMTGEVIGNGRANAFVEDDEGRWFVVFAYNNQQSRFMNAATGFFKEVGNMFAGNAVQNSEIKIPFNNKCIETCYLKGDFNKGEVDLVFSVGKGATLKITKVSYQFEDASIDRSSVSFKLGRFFSGLVHLFD